MQNNKIERPPPYLIFIIIGSAKIRTKWSPLRSFTTTVPRSDTLKGSKMAEAVTDFCSLGLDSVLVNAIKTAFEIETPSEIQKKVLPALLKDDAPAGDILLRSKTGSGKTLAFLLPILQRLLLSKRGKDTKEARLMGTKVLILVPTRELAAQTQTTLEKLLAKIKGSDHWICSGTLSGGDRRKSEKERLRRGLHIVVATPGRLLDHIQNTAKWAAHLRETCSWIALDEADRLLDVGFAKFIKEILEKIVGGKSMEDRAKFLLCSATVDHSLKDIFGYQLNSPNLIAEDPLVVKKDTAIKGKRETTGPSEADLEAARQLEHFYLCTPTKMRLAILTGLLGDIFTSSTPQKVVLFTICCDTVDFLTMAICKKPLKMLPTGVKLSKLHGNLEHKVRMETFKEFSQETGNCVLVCTDVAARGLNLTRVTHIIQYDAPCDMNDYIHRAGRTARQQEKGKSILFLMPSERDYIAEFQKRNVEIKALPWEPFAQSIADRVAASASVEDDEGEEEALAGVGRLEPESRKKIFKWIQDLQELIKADAALFQAAKTAFLSYIRAYATHPAAEKTIFHVKKLHLGHLASTFLLAEPPKSVAANHSGNTSSKKEKEVWKGKPEGSNENRARSIIKKPRRIVSEFDAGDVGASYLQPRLSKLPSAAGGNKNAKRRKTK